MTSPSVDPTALAHSPSLPPDALAVDRARARLRGIRAATAIVHGTVVGLALAITVLLATRLSLVHPPLAARLFLLAALVPIVAGVASAFTPIPRLRAARLLDRAFGLHDALSSALEFRAIPAPMRTPMMTAAIEATEARVRTAPPDPRVALPWHWPAETLGVLALLVLLLGVSRVPFHPRRTVPPARPRTTVVVRDPVALSSDDIQAFQAVAEDLRTRAPTPASRRAIEDFQRLLTDIARHAIDRQEAFRRLAALESAQRDAQELDAAAIAPTLQRVAEQIGTPDELSRRFAEALRQGDPAGARDAAHALAERLRAPTGTTESQRQAMARSLERASRTPGDQAALEERVRQAREAVERSLAQQRQRSLTPQETAQLHQRETELQRARDASDSAQRQRQAMENLQRRLGEAARDTERNPRQAAGAMEQSAQDLSQMQAAQEAQRTSDELHQRMDELAEQMRQQNGANGQRQRSRIERFAQAARGQPAGGSQGSQGEQGAQGSQGGSAGQNSPGGRGGPAQQGQAGGTQASSAGGSPGAGTPRGNNGQGAGTMNPGGQGSGGTPMAMPGTPGGTPSPEGTPGSTAGGQQAGTEHDANILGDATRVARENRTLQVQGAGGPGPTRSQVIRTAAADGFANAPYRTVYAPYWDHAREVLHEAEVPPGYRSYVRRYFQLIRPRE